MSAAKSRLTYEEEELQVHFLLVRCWFLEKLSKPARLNS